MKISPILFLFSLLYLSGCGERKADLSEPKTHRSGSLTFDYPKNWKVTEDSNESGVHYLFVETPGDGLVIIQSFPSETVDDFETFAGDFSETAAGEMAPAKMTDSKFSGTSESHGYDWITEDFTIKLLGESLAHKRFYGWRVIGDKTLILIFQVANEDLEKTEGGFWLIRDTLEFADKR